MKEKKIYIYIIIIIKIIMRTFNLEPRRCKAGLFLGI